MKPEITLICRNEGYIMPVNNFELTLIDGQRLVDMKEKPSKLRIDHNTTITQITKVDEGTVEIKFRYTVSYGHVGTIRVEGKLNFSGNTEEILSLWAKEHRMQNKIAEEVHNIILSNGSFEAVLISRKLNLPPPIKMEIPRVKFSDKQKKVSPDYSPEVA